MDSNSPTVVAGSDTVTVAFSDAMGATVAVGITFNPGSDKHSEFFVTRTQMRSVDAGSLASELESAGIGTDKQQEILAHVAQQMTSHGEGTGQ